MLFDNYKLHTDTVIRPSLLWEYDLSRFDWMKMRNVVVQSVLERGRMDDYYAMLNLYGWEGVRDALRRKPLQWNRIEKRLLSMDKYPKRIFEAL